MNIGIDVDGVLTDIQGFNRRHAPRFFRRKFNREVADENSCDIRDIFKCPENEYQEYWKKHLLRYAVFEPARKGARSLTRRLRSQGHSVFIISKCVFISRNDLLGLYMRLLMRIWVWRNGIICREIVFCGTGAPNSKRDACLEKHIDVMIDDEEADIKAIAPIAETICFDASYNRDCGGENITRARNWDEVYTTINTISYKKGFDTNLRLKARQDFCVQKTKSPQGCDNPAERKGGQDAE